MLHTTAILDASMIIKDALKRLEPYPDESLVVIRNRQGFETNWSYFTIHDIRGVLSDHGINATKLIDFIQLSLYEKITILDYDDIDSGEMDSVQGILLDGDNVVGVLIPESIEVATPKVQTKKVPEGRNVVLDKSFEAPSVNKDGASVSKEIETAKKPPLDDSVLYTDELVHKSQPLPNKNATNQGKIKSTPFKKSDIFISQSDNNTSLEDFTFSENKSRGLSGRILEQVGRILGQGKDKSIDGLGGLLGGLLGGQTTKSIPAEEIKPDKVVSPNPNVISTKSNTSHFEAYPKMECPNGVHSGDQFNFSVGLAPEKTSSSMTSVVVEEAPSDKFELTVLIIAPGFNTPAGTTRKLHVNRENPYANEVSFELFVLDDPDSSKLRTIEIQFSYNGNICGRAWREITVLPRSITVKNAPISKTGSSPVSTPGLYSAPDLTVTITEADEDGHFIWSFDSQHPVDLHTHKQIETKLKYDNARSFGTRLLKGIPTKEGSTQVGMHIKGASRQIAQEMPFEFWKVLGDVWRITKDKDDIPRILILSAEPYVPWELASVESDYIDPSLLDVNKATFLNVQTNIGRWIPPRPRTPRGGTKPPQPPSSLVNVNQMAVVSGDYLAINGIRPLPEAKEEGEKLTETYGAVLLTAIWENLKKLMKNEIVKNNKQVDIDLIHFACHGKVDHENPLHNGIVLNNGKKLDPTTTRGSLIGKATQPFVFMNACEVGAAGETLGSYGGFAAAFLNEGFRGFIAPLWAVNDKIAHDFAIQFYDMTLVENKTVSSTLRKLRTNFDPDESIYSTHIAYQFYGHPDLLLKHQ